MAAEAVHASVGTTTEIGSLVTRIHYSEASYAAWKVAYTAVSVLGMCPADSTDLNHQKQLSADFRAAVKKIDRGDGRYSYMPTNVSEEIAAIVALVTPLEQKEAGGVTALAYRNVEKWGESAKKLQETLQDIEPKRAENGAVSDCVIA